MFLSRDERQTGNTQGKVHETIPGLQPTSPTQTSQQVTSQELQSAFQHSGMAPGVMVTGPPPGTQTHSLVCTCTRTYWDRCYY